VHLVDDPLALRGGDPARLGDRDDPRAAVESGRAALGQPAAFQVVDGADHGRLVQVGEGGELDLGALRLQRVHEDTLHPRRQVDGGERFGEAAGQRVAGHVEQAGDVALLAPGGCGGHDTRVTRSSRTG
jgi:hypothetical protein